MRTFEVTPDRHLQGEIDAEARIARVPPEHTIKGVFCQSLVDLLEKDWSELQSRLIAPPAGGRYEPLSDYPQRDYCRIALQAATRLFPDTPLPQAARRLGRQDLMFFASQPMGRALFNPGVSLSRIFEQLPHLYAMVVRGGLVRSELVGERSAHVSFEDYHGWVDSYTVGTIEGIVLHYDRRPTLEVTVLSSVDADYVVHWE